ncbi:TATA box-binding protein-associated factor RNA polymerase I subunit A isoform X2 [Pseudophryne corroboree]|uniref:TATA box-binding protein-associated factor RNA polymerase I subunit A isoform X2 n=1 Tax=Pseudophryne corroboree TaxID=495146 RepID=UPI003081C9FC
METDTSLEQSGGEEELLRGQDGDPGISLPRRRTHNSVLTKRLDSAWTADLCLQLIHKAMERRQWSRAATLFSSFVQNLDNRSNKKYIKAAEAIWRLGSEILLNHPGGTSDEIHLFHETMKNIGVKNYLQIILEQVYFLLCNGRTDEAYRILSAAESWRFGRLSISQDKLLKLIQAYRAVLDHRAWQKKISAVTQDAMDYASQSSHTQDACSSFRQASSTFREITQFPGVWDPFILCYVDLLETSGDLQEAETVLMNYAYNSKNPANPNAHVYLYEFLQRTKASDDKVIKVLKILQLMVPSHKHMLKFSKLLVNSGVEEHHHLALQVLLELLDYPVWKEDVKAWRYLAKQLKRCLCRERKAWVSELWESRSSWWPLYHFTKLQANKDYWKCPELAVRKAAAAGMLQGPGSRYFSRVCRLGTEEQKATLSLLKTLLKQHNCGNQ